MTDETPTRKAHTKEVLRELFAKSGNVCAFPGCSNLMIKADGKYVGQICHIEGVKGERFRKDMTNDERAAMSNLMLLCYEHHIETDDDTTWTVERLQKMKADHEALFTDPETKLYQGYVDRTSQRSLRRSISAARFAKALDWPMEPEHVADVTDELNAIFSKVEKLDIQSRYFLLSVVRRAWRVNGTPNVMDKSGHLLLRWDDFTEAMELSDDEVRKRIDALEAHHIGTHDDDSMEIGGRPVYSIQLYRAPQSGVDYWMPIAEFCEKTAESLEHIIVHLELTRFD